MTKHLYNCKTDGDQYRITKFTPDLEVESSYLLTETECECPAGHRHSCRHRQMLPKFIDRRATRGQWFLDYATDKWIIASGATLEDLGQDHETTGPMPGPAAAGGSAERTFAPTPVISMLALAATPTDEPAQPATQNPKSTSTPTSPRSSLRRI